MATLWAAPARAAAASPRCSTTVSVVGPKRIWSKSRSWAGRVGVSSQTTLSWRAALTASHSRSARTARKSPRRTTLAPGMAAIEASSMLITLAPEP